jgi:hypothetical protein
MVAGKPAKEKDPPFRPDVSPPPREMPEGEQDAVLYGPGPAERGVMRLGVRSLGGAIGQRSYDLRGQGR